MSDVLAITALFVSFVSVIWSIYTYLTVGHKKAVSANTDLIVEIEGRFGANPGLLRFHGIADPLKELEKHGLTAEEFAYLVNSFTVAGTLYRTSPFPRSILREGSYRRMMCEARATQRAWPLVRLLIAATPYRDAIDKLMQDLQQPTAHGDDRVNESATQ